MVLKVVEPNGHAYELKNVVRLKYSKQGGLLQVFQNDTNTAAVDLNFNEIEVLEASAPHVAVRSGKSFGKSES